MPSERFFFGGKERYMLKQRGTRATDIPDHGNDSQGERHKRRRNFRFANGKTLLERERNLGGNVIMVGEDLAVFERIGGGFGQFPTLADTIYGTNASPTYSKRFSAVFQLMTSQIAPKYSALRF